MARMRTTASQPQCKFLGFGRSAWRTFPGVREGWGLRRAGGDLVLSVLHIPVRVKRAVPPAALQS